MIYLSAQPDDFYFTWQLDLQLYNFHRLGIPPGDIHVLVGYDPQRGLKSRFAACMERNGGRARFFAYPDNRRARSYPSSIRPHLIAQHLSAHPQLVGEALFYHDSDVVFRTRLDTFDLPGDSTWYVSDTREYLDSAYIRRTGGAGLLEEMCRLVGISPEMVVQNDPCCGGAQYVLKNTTPAFWEKVERDCERLYDLLVGHQNARAEAAFISYGSKRSAVWGIQSWCADMWALLWNAWLEGREVRIHPGLSFCWPSDPLQKWETRKILHYSGLPKGGGKVFFDKTRYLHYPPFLDPALNDIERDSCSFPLAALIREYAGELKRTRIALQDVSFLIPVRIDTSDRLENLYAVTTCLDKYFHTRILVAESDTHARVDATRLPEGCGYVFCPDDQPQLHRTKLNNYLIRWADTPIVALYDTDVILDTRQVGEAAALIRSGQAEMVYPYDGRFAGVDRLFKRMFIKLLDPSLFVTNLGKCTVVTERSLGGAVFLNREAFIRAGLENEFFKSWGPEDAERAKRMKRLGYRVRRVPGPIFHLPHERGNSRYVNLDAHISYMNEYLRICNMPRPELEAYVARMPWVVKAGYENN